MILAAALELGAGVGDSIAGEYTSVRHGTCLLCPCLGVFVAPPGLPTLSTAVLSHVRIEKSIHQRYNLGCGSEPVQIQRATDRPRDEHPQAGQGGRRLYRDDLQPRAWPQGFHMAEDGQEAGRGPRGGSRRASRKLAALLVSVHIATATSCSSAAICSDFIVFLPRFYYNAPNVPTRRCAWRNLSD